MAQTMNIIAEMYILSYEEKFTYLMLNDWTPIKKVNDQYIYWETPLGDLVHIDYAMAIATGKFPMDITGMEDED